MAKNDFMKIAAVVVIAWFLFGQDSGTTAPPTTGTTDFCGNNDGQTVVTFSVQNIENETGIETFNVGTRWCADGECLAQTASSATSVTLNCGEMYTIQGLSQSGADSAKFYSVLSGSATVSGDGTATYTPSLATQTLILGGKEHGILQFRAFDVLNDGFLFTSANGANGSTVYVEEGSAIWNSSTNGNANTAVGTGGEVHYKVYYRPTVDDRIWGDVGGYYVLVEAATTVWEVPSVSVNGATLSNYKSNLNSDEAKAYADYEYVYWVSEGMTKSSEHNVDLQIFALSGIDPTTDIEIDFASRGAYASITNSNLVKLGSVQDDSSQTVVHALQDTSIDLS